MLSYIVCTSMRHSIRVRGAPGVCESRARRARTPVICRSLTRAGTLCRRARVRHRARVSSLGRHGGLFDSQPTQEANHASAHGFLARAADSLRHRSCPRQHAPGRACHPHPLGAARRAGGLLGARGAGVHRHVVHRRARIADAHPGPRAAVRGGLQHLLPAQLQAVRQHRRVEQPAADARRHRRHRARVLLRRRELVVLVDVLAVHPRGRLHPARRAAGHGSWRSRAWCFSG